MHVRTPLSEVTQPADVMRHSASEKPIFAFLQRARSWIPNESVGRTHDETTSLKVTMETAATEQGSYSGECDEPYV